MKTLILSTLLTVIFSAHGHTHNHPEPQAPKIPLPSIKKLFKKYVFVDFQKVHYDIKIDLKKKEVRTYTKIDFLQDKKGRVIFDLKRPCMKAKIDGKKVGVKTILIPGTFSPTKTLRRKTRKGAHTLEIEARLKRGVDFEKGVEIGMWIRDLLGRKFLEQYLPTNFEYDQYAATMNIEFIGADAKEYEIMVNGEKTLTDKGASVVFPEWYTSSAFFVHIFKKGTYVFDRSEYIRLDGKKIPLIIYSPTAKFTADLKKQALISLESLEGFYGRYGHDFMIIYGENMSGGMEHAGATQTSLGALDHEIHHFWIGKSVIPENGNAGWMDEAIVTWRQRGFKLNEKPSFKRHNMACHSRYRRATDWDSYDKGSSFIGHIAYLFKQKGLDLKETLRNWYAVKEYKIVNTQMFREFLEKAYGESLKGKFRQYICNPRLFKRWRRGTNPH